MLLIARRINKSCQEFALRIREIFQRLLFRLISITYFFEDCKRKRQRLHELQINTTQQLSNYQIEDTMYLQSLMTVHVRWLGQTSGAFGLALIFLVLFASRQKEHEDSLR